jgi:zinc D-Ala-D-Ala carboxypeptidase
MTTEQSNKETTELSLNFSLKELTHSDKAINLKIDNTPTPNALVSLYILASTLELIRKAVGKPMKISSGYRSPKLNAAVGGSPSSSHCLGLAADFTVSGMTPRQVAEKIVAAGIVLDQLILENISATNPDGVWVHVGLSTTKNRQGVLTKKVGDKKYYSGLIHY